MAIHPDDSVASCHASLQSICYHRGSLRLLDQRKLPLEETYLDIQTASDGWNAIRDMVVRGAPAIAIAAALSLAVEVDNLNFVGSSEEAASFLIEKLDYLVSSRPTAVNLSDAVSKLKTLVKKVVETKVDAKSVFQGSRLTAFELVHDKIPARLIADSAAAALMRTGRVDAVVVGADRIASNGDTANKIGTYNLALAAQYHGIPFYVAAPITSIDLSLSSGDQIIIEERSAKELLNSRGGLGEQIAASGISVWNPAFDVTPASLITAIVTEKGVITKSESNTFNIKHFVESVPAPELSKFIQA